MIDVCLILEGTYPYVSGGVSTWVHQLINAIKDVRFGIIYIAAHSDPTRTLKYELPPHVLYFKEVYLHDYNFDPCAARGPKKKDYEDIHRFHEEVIQGHYEGLPRFVEMFRGPNACFDLKTFLYSPQIYDLLKQFCMKYAADHSFIDFFWTWRGMQLPILQILNAEIPPAKVYHAVSTGYAGLLSAIAKLTHHGKFLLTEHGIYTYERMLEISQATWIYEGERKTFRIERDLSLLKRWWIMLFHIISRLAYHYCDQIFTLYEGNRTRQILNGALPEKVHIIPNGIDIQGFAAIKRSPREAPQIGLIGRVVTIKDIKTFIHAAELVLREIPAAEFYVVGPTSEEEDYYDECRALTISLNLEDKIQFTGRDDVRKYYEFLDLVVLTSISEGQPYAILEANICGIPVVATDVGACREMLEGMDEEDRLLGTSGLLTEIGSPQSTAAAILRLLKDRSLYQHCSLTGKTRVKNYYDQDDLFSRYLNVYERNF